MIEKVQEIIPNHFSLPRRIERLGELAYNLWWTWNPNVQRLFERIDNPHPGTGIQHAQDGERLRQRPVFRAGRQEQRLI